MRDKVPSSCRSLALEDRIVFSEPCQLEVDMLAALTEGGNLREQLEQTRVQQNGHRVVDVRQRVANGLDRALRTDRDADAEVAQAAAKEVVREVRATFHCERRRCNCCRAC